MEGFIILIIIVALFSAAGRKALGTFASIGCGIIVFIVGAAILVMGFGAGFHSCSNGYNDDSYYQDQSWQEEPQPERETIYINKSTKRNKKESMKRKTKRQPKPQTEPKVNKNPIIEYQEEEE